jgi:AAA family ATP:ADP antiporter
VALFFTYALLLMLSYYILKTLREPLLLTGSSAEMKSYATAVIALILLLVIPLYGWIFRRIRKQQLTRYVTVFFLFNLLLFWLSGRAGLDIGFAYYVWVGIFNLMITAQFWAYAADSYETGAGKRLFPVIMIGATLGSMLGPPLTGLLFPLLGPWLLMLIASFLLLLTVPLVARARAAIPPEAAGFQDRPDERSEGGLLGGISFVFTDRYLFLVALLIVLLNWVNTTGEYILAEDVVRQADAAVAAGTTAGKSEFIAGFYGYFYLAVNALSLVLQIFVVARVIQHRGVAGALLVLPLITLLGYGGVAILPAFGLILMVKLMENSVDYSLMNTARHSLYLPLSAARIYEGKTAIETFFWRLGDLIQAGVIFGGLHWLGLGIPGFAAINACLSVCWLLVAWKTGRIYREKQIPSAAAAVKG